MSLQVHLGLSSILETRYSLTYLLLFFFPPERGEGEAPPYIPIPPYPYLLGEPYMPPPDIFDLYFLGLCFKFLQGHSPNLLLRFSLTNIRLRPLLPACNCFSSPPSRVEAVSAGVASTTGAAGISATGADIRFCFRYSKFFFQVFFK